jgi:flagellar biogenesis protein FliO
MIVSAASPQGAPPAIHQAVVSSSPIPFRKTSIVSGSEVFGMLVATLLILAAFAALAWIARRQGWLERWTRSVPLARDGQRTLSVVEVLRISRRTTVYRIGSGNAQYLLAESTTPIVMAAVHVEPEACS